MVTVALKLYGPVVLSLIALTAIFATKVGQGQTTLTLHPLPFTDFQIPVSNNVIAKVLLVIGIPGFLSAYLFYDYTKFFPKNMDMEVFYDDSGIQQSLRVFSSPEMESLHIAKDDKAYRRQYFEKLDAELSTALRAQRRFFSQEGSLHSAGTTSIVVEKTGVWQDYHVVKADGQLTNVLEAANLPSQTIYTRFEKLPTGGDYVHLTLRDLLVSRSMILRVQNKQFLIEYKAQEEVPFKVSVSSATKVSIFPWPRIANTVYFADFAGVGFVPVAYAVYKWP